ncbi:hypothetical protein AS034_16540 [[Bacillus] enclensis]|uniref:Uncharacterized protein n=1 Tax=[Bacillus] enclensis TaxID=1402860 RepID=A0A0V8HDR3_9BACI|nr:hypothetical protein [[Bacillus] enclensis]KSU60449.1 hypothetical protein AS034_16540 [[Bacillus] enclensis]SCC24625.1 hypothetical protein GA0061094_3421 [[Bacillus] enclensis]
MKELNMKVNPLYSEVDLSIQFHFEFVLGESKIGEALVSTYAIQDNSEMPPYNKGISYRKTSKCAVIDRFEVINETEKLCMNKLHHFLQVIGMREIHSGYDLYQEA